MKSQILCLVFIAVLTGCASHKKYHDASYAGTEVHGGYEENGIGSTKEWVGIRSDLPAGVGAGLPLGGHGIYPSAPPPVFMAPVPVIPDGHRAMEQMQTGGVQLVPVPASELMTKKQGQAIGQKVRQIDERVGDLEEGKCGGFR